MYKGVLLDIDGTLVDSNDPNARAWVEALQDSGYSVPFDKIRRMIGMGGDNLLPKAIGKDNDSPEGKKASEKRGEIMKSQYMPNLKPFPGVRELLHHMHDAGLKLVTASSAKADEADTLLRITGAPDLFDVKTASDDAHSSKPDPDIVQVALKKSGLAPADVLMIGDTPFDIEAAQKSGVSTIAFRCGGWSDDDLAGALAIYDGPADLLANYDASPLGVENR